jgi:prepilin-type N-terminal cleavage/methylation domain-containing protein
MVLHRIYTSNKGDSLIGFTLFEVLIVMSMMSIIASATMFFSYHFYKQEILVAEKANLIVLLQSARALAMQNIGQQPHGVAIDPEGYVGYVAFSGDSFEASDETYRTFVPRSSLIAFSENSPPQILFYQLSGQTDNNVTFMLQDVNSTASNTVTVNYEGAIY